MSSALRKYNSSLTPVSAPVDDRQVKNNTGGFVYEVSDATRLDRFLILGVDGGTYYVSERDLTEQNVSWLQKLIQKDAGLVLDRVFDVSHNGRAYRNSAAVFTLAMVLNYGDDAAKARVVSMTPLVARIATHVYELAQYIENLGGWGRAKRRAIVNWFKSKTADELAYQAVKYRQRNGWTLRDLMRLSHPVGVDSEVGAFILGHGVSDASTLGILQGFSEIQSAQTVSEVCSVLQIYKSLPWETVPTQFHKDPAVWKTLFYNGQLKGQALVRNVVRLARAGAFNDLSFAGDYAKALTDEEMIRKSRLHPVQFLLASITYEEGQTVRGQGIFSSSRNKDWNTNPKILKALQDGFYKAFKYSEPSGNRIRIGVDVSGSMSWSSAVGADITAAQGSAIMALTLARQEDYVEILGFANTLRDLAIHDGMGFSQVLKKVQLNNFGHTDPSLLIQDAMNSHQEFDTFVVITDNEVNSGTHPSRMLKNYRDKMGIDAKLVVMGMTSTGFTIADPSDRGMLDVCGFDANVPKVITDFMSGKI